MNYIFRSYPAHPWFAGWSVEPRGCGSAFRQSGAGQFFKTLETVGKIAPNVEIPDWTLQIPVPPNSRINMLFNGFCAYYDRKKARLATEVLTPEPGVLWGRFDGVSSPVLASDLASTEFDGGQWLEGDDGAALLMLRGDSFCLVSKLRLRVEAERLAESYLNKNLEEVLADEFGRREGAHSLFEEMAHHDALAVISAESMMKALRPAEGDIPLAWCQSTASDVPRMDVNELHPQALAWRLMDPEVAEELLMCALKIQTNAGAIPVHYSPRGTSSIMEAPKPLLAKTTETVWSERKNDAFLLAALPLLRRHIQWLLHHFDPKRRGLHVWKNQGEPIVPQIFETDLATVDLSVLLITEIDALNRMRASSSLYANDPDHFETERAALERNLLEVFWNEEERSFCNAILRDKTSTLKGFASFTPLLWNKLPHDKRETILERVHESGELPGGLSVLSWRKSAMDDDTFPLIQQLFVFQALQISDPHGQLLNDFARVTLQGFVEWHTLALQKENRLHINPVLGAFIMNVQAIRQYRYHAKGNLSGGLFRLFRKYRADRFDLAVVAATIFTIFSVHLVYDVLHAPPPYELLETEMNAAYANRNADETIKNCMAIIQHYPEQADRALLLVANISMLNGREEQAIEFYEKARERFPDSPGPMIALGLAYQLRGRFNDAEDCYYEFCYIFEEIFPELVAEINGYRILAREGFKSPPKWREIYRYQLMHEL